MKMNEYLRLHGILKSFEQSTYLRFECRGVKIELGRRASEYISHRTVEFGVSSIENPNQTVITNTKYQLLVNHGHLDAKVAGDILTPLDVEYDVMVAEVPATMVVSLLEEVCKTNLFTRPWLPLIRVAFCYPRAVGFTEDGKPIFKPSLRPLEETAQ